MKREIPEQKYDAIQKRFVKVRVPGKPSRPGMYTTIIGVPKSGTVLEIKDRQPEGERASRVWTY